MISASFHHDSRRDKPSSDTARETMRKISFKPTSRRSSHLQSGQDLPASRRRGTEPTVICRASDQVAQVFGTYNLPTASAAVAAVTGSCVTPAGGRTATARDAAHANPG